MFNNHNTPKLASDLSQEVYAGACAKAVDDNDLMLLKEAIDNLNNFNDQNVRNAMCVAASGGMIEFVDAFIATSKCPQKLLDLAVEGALLENAFMVARKLILAGAGFTGCSQENVELVLGQPSEAINNIHKKDNAHYIQNVVDFYCDERLKEGGNPLAELDGLSKWKRPYVMQSMMR